jgi:hypothetical protein
MSDQPKLPSLPEPVLFRAAWDGAPGWTQYHDERDPLPTQWDDEPPDEVQGFFSGDQVRSAQLAAYLAGMEQAAKIAEVTADDFFTVRGYGEMLRRIRGEKDIPDYFLGLAERIGTLLGDPELARRAAAIRRAAEEGKT